MKRAVLFPVLLLLILLCACETTRIYWVPVYSMDLGRTTETMKFDPRIQSIVNPEDGILTAYYETDTKKGTVYGNEYSLSLSEKVVFKDDKIVGQDTTPKMVTNLDLYKSFYYNYWTENESDRRLYIFRNSTLIALDRSSIGKEQDVEYVILGKNVGTNAIDRIVIADVLPAGFAYKESAYSVAPKVGSFTHKVIVKKGKTSIILASDFITPLPPGDTFRIKIRLGAQFDKMEKEFDR